MSWQLIFKAPDTEPQGEPGDPELDRPASRKPVSMTVQIEPGAMVIVAAGDDEDDD
jgi:hypothetical protein